MALFDMFKRLDVNEGLEEYRQTPGAVLLDVRSAEEYAEVHIPGSINVPMELMRIIERFVPNKSTPVFAYCFNGFRSGTAAKMMQRAGYKNVKNIGGINTYQGPLER